MLHADVLVTVHYELYAGLPLFSKWVSIESNSVRAKEVRAGFKVVEELNVNFQWAKQGYDWMEVN